MARYIGAVRFEDGLLLHFVYDGTTDIALPRLYATQEAASVRRRAVHTAPIGRNGVGEAVEVMPFVEQGSDKVEFRSTADRARMMLTGPRSYEEQFAVARGGWDGHG